MQLKVWILCIFTFISLIIGLSDGARTNYQDPLQLLASLSVNQNQTRDYFGSILSQILSSNGITNSNVNAGNGRVFFQTDPVTGSQSVVGSWFSFTNWTLTLAVFGTAFLLACSATAVYYVLFVVTEPSQQHKRSLLMSTGNDNTNSFQNSIWFSLDKWSFPQILDLIHMAYDVYFTLDLENMECQKKVLCEFQEPDLYLNGIEADVSRRISNFLLFLDVFLKFPHIKQYQEAVKRGQQRHQDKSCDDNYPDCLFSVQNFNLKYNRVFNN